MSGLKPPVVIAIAVTGVLLIGGAIFALGGSDDSERKAAIGDGTAPAQPGEKLVEDAPGSQLRLTAGRVAWVRDGTVYSAPVSASGGAVTVGDPTATGPFDSPDAKLAVSGRRTAVISDGRLSISDGEAAKVTGGFTGKMVLSGSRVLVQNLARIVGFVGGNDSQSLNENMDRGSATLFGNMVYDQDGTNSIVQTDLSDGRQSKLRHLNNGGPVYAWGPYWAACDPTGACYLRTNPSKIILGAGETMDALTSDGVLIKKDSAQAGLPAGNYGYRILSYTGRITNLTGVRGHDVSVEDSIVAWIGLDGKPRVAPLADASNPPRTLGWPLVRAYGSATPSASFKPGTRWSVELPTTAPLTSCSVKFSSGTTVVRTVSCDADVMKTGEAKGFWDGKNDSGVVQPAGKYTWQISAAGVDGALVTSGTADPGTTGTVEILA